MNTTQTIPNCPYFLQPTRLGDWNVPGLPGIVGVMVPSEDGGLRVVDVFAAESVPSRTDLIRDERFSTWLMAAGSVENIRFDVFLMPQASPARRRTVLDLLNRSVQQAPQKIPAYAHAV